MLCGAIGDLTIFQTMAKRSGKPGADTVVDDIELTKRYQNLVLFLENEWGLIGQELMQATAPEDIRDALCLVPDIASRFPFRDDPIVCILGDSCSAEPLDVGFTRKQYESAKDDADRSARDYQRIKQQAEDAITAFRSGATPLRGGCCHSPLFFFVLAALRQQLSVDQLIADSDRLELQSRIAQQKKDMVGKKLAAEEAWFARKHVLGLVQSDRYENSLENFAKVMAGLPEYHWLPAIRRLPHLKHDPQKSTNSRYKLFLLVSSIVKQSQALDLADMELKLRKELLSRKAEDLVRSYVAPSWYFVQQSFRECHGRKLPPEVWPFQIMSRILNNFDRNKAFFEAELAKNNQLK